MIPHARHAITDDDRAAVMAVLDSPRLTQGEKVAEFEASLCAASGARYAVAVSSGTAALWCAAGVRTRLAADNDVRLRVTVPAITFVATANAFRLHGAEVVIGDIDPATWCMKPPGVMVTFAGYPCETDDTTRIVDAAHGPLRKGGEFMRCLSFHPSKAFTTGEGGAVLTDVVGAYEALCRWRDNGRATAAEQPQFAGLNLRMSDIHAALGISQLRRYPSWQARRRAIAAHYWSEFASIECQGQHRHPDHAYHLFILWLDPARYNRDDVRGRLAERGVGTQIHYEPLYRLPEYVDVYASTHSTYKPPQRYPNAERYYAGCLSIPMSHTLTDGEVEHVVKSVKEVLA